MRHILLSLVALACLALPTTALSQQVPADWTATRVVVSTTPVLLSAARSGRKEMVLTVGAANTCTFGPTSAASATGLALQPVAGASFTLRTQGAFWAQCSASTTITVVETF